ncbi:hypothetical protein FA95DRAFT_1554493 [Auriscalpium vulgare]|uniref:Uncharacterized protein n=1 Tax=Auriscalpium vulgare TaxID=40419 RepID=A0ACB8S4I8_9AGAM|nr:hypothetical protein FA95DRAFT_1554493 [Auriscalpium vulgare]
MFTPISHTPAHDPLTADDPSARMRAHGGNRPSLPQTKQCPLCPAKFTRTTHLNRHLRTHTNERSHRCDTCLSEFTRSDLLTRHKRSCGDMMNQNKSRRKSCEACAESKIKCDLKQPCSKCITRGRECVFLNDPKISLEKKAAAASRRRASNASSKSTLSDAGSISSPDSPTSQENVFPSSSFPYTIDGNSDLSLIAGSSSAFDMSSGDLLFRPSSDGIVPDLSASSSTSSSMPMSPRSDIFDMPNEFSYAMVPEMDILDASLSKIIPHDIAQAFPEAAQSTHTLSTQNFGRNNLMDFSFTGQTWLGDDMPTPSIGNHINSFLDTSLNPSDAAAPAASASVAPTSQPMMVDSIPKDLSFHGPAEAELQHYLYLFHHAFLSHMPIVHVPTWSFDGKPPILLRAMQACGALFVKTRAANEFVSNTLLNTRESLIQEVVSPRHAAYQDASAHPATLQAKNPQESDEQFHLILAGLLLQAIGLFHQSIDQRASSNIYHGMLVMMIRRCGLIGRCANWVPPDLSGANSTQIESAWKCWTTQEAIKRTLYLAYLHDCCHYVFFSLQPSFFLSELDWCLPTEDALWQAGSAQEWYDLLQQPSPYGNAAVRLSGQNMQKTLATLGDMQMATAAPATVLPPFAHFVLIHSVLCSVYISCFDGASSRAASPGLPEPTAALQALPLEGRHAKANSFVLQYTLHNWLQSWLSGPDTPPAEEGVEEARFMQNAMPYYWLAQISLVAFQEGAQSPASRKPDFCTAPEVRYRVLQRWLLHIRGFLRSGAKAPTNLWVDLMKIADEGGHGNSGTPDGLLSFFPDF